jgi:hypothetical protein
MKLPLLALALVAVVATWAKARFDAVALRAEIDELRSEAVELKALRLERDRLHRLHSAVEARIRLQDAPAREDQPAGATPFEAPSSYSTASLRVGEWTSIDQWKNRGRGTPMAAIETALWAAAGGDVNTLRSLLRVDDAVRARAQAIHDRLPEVSRALYPTAEDVIAAFTAKSIPLGDAQIVWQRQEGPDRMMACVFVKDPEAPAVSSDSQPLQESNAPPARPPSNSTRLGYLSVERGSDGGWQLVVPPGATEQIARELGASG